MLTEPWFYIIAVALLIVITLAVYAGKLLKQLKLQNEKIAAAELAHQQALKKHDTKVLNSVVIIVRAMKEEQCDIAEGCWRLSVLMDSLKLPAIEETPAQKFPAIFQLYEAIKHMPILEERKKLEKKERMKLDFERMKVEADLSSAVKSDVELLHTFAVARIAEIS